MTAVQEAPAAERAMTAWTSGGDPVSYEPVFEDPSLPHQIIILAPSRDTKIAVSCNCLNGHGHVSRGHPRQLIESRDVFPARDAIAAYARWHSARGIEVRP